jgi:hypothetical protein
MKLPAETHTQLYGMSLLLLVRAGGFPNPVTITGEEGVLK